MVQSLPIFQRIIGSLASRLPAGSSSKQLMVDAVLWQLEEVTYSRLKNCGFRPGCVVDVGAHIGQWTRTTKSIFSDVPFVMIEARDEMRSDLERTATEFADVKYHIALLGPKESAAAVFYTQGSASSLYRERSDAPMTQTSLPMTTLDNILSTSTRAPLFLKLDLQGAELDVLRGGNATLKKTEIVQLEIALLPYNDKAPTAAEVITFMDKQGFAIYDIAGFIRPNGKDLVQLDVIFVRKTSNLRPNSFRFTNAPA